MALPVHLRYLPNLATSDLASLTTYESVSLIVLSMVLPQLHPPEYLHPVVLAAAGFLIIFFTYFFFWLRNGSNDNWLWLSFLNLTNKISL